MRKLKEGVIRLGRMSWGLAALILGLPLPLVLLAFLIGGCRW